MAHPSIGLGTVARIIDVESAGFIAACCTTLTGTTKVSIDRHQPVYKSQCPSAASSADASLASTSATGTDGNAAFTAYAISAEAGDAVACSPP
jgi:hypothetical protein